MDLKRGDPRLLDHPVARDLLQAAIPAHLSYVALDGTPRVVPLLFHWTGDEVVVTSWPDDLKIDAISAHPQVALTIDTVEPPYKVLSIRGTATVSVVDGLPDECLPMFTRYHGPEGGQAWTERMAQMTDHLARIAIRPEWVEVLDFERRLPSGMARRMRAIQAA